MNKIEQHRDDLEDLADKDLPAAGIAETLLDVIDAED